MGASIGIGKHSVTVLEQLELLENCQQVTSGISREISTLIVVDRNLDYASALLSPLTYEALLNEVFKNTCGTIGKLQFLIILIFAKCTEIQRRKNNPNCIYCYYFCYLLNTITQLFERNDL